MDYVDGIDVMQYMVDWFLVVLLVGEVFVIVIVVVGVFDYVYQCGLLYCDVNFVNVVLISQSVGD